MSKFNLWQRLFGSSEITGSIVKASINTGDKLFYTKEERAEDSLTALKLVTDYMKATTGSDLARRVIATAVTGTFVVYMLILIPIGVAFIFVSDPDALERLIRAKDFFIEVLSLLIGMIMTILAFYFTHGGIRNYLKTKQK